MNLISSCPVQQIHDDKKPRLSCTCLRKILRFSSECIQEQKFAFVGTRASGVPPSDFIPSVLCPDFHCPYFTPKSSFMSVDRFSSNKQTTRNTRAHGFSDTGSFSAETCQITGWGTYYATSAIKFPLGRICLPSIPHPKRQLHVLQLLILQWNELLF